MEKYLSNETEECLNEIVFFIKSSKEYKECIRLKEEMSKDLELIEFIEEVKKRQRKYVLSNYSKEKKKELDEKLNLLNNNNLFVLYSYYLNKVNDMILQVKEELNDYFYDVTNILSND